MKIPRLLLTNWSHACPNQRYIDLTPEEKSRSDSPVEVGFFPIIYKVFIQYEVLLDPMKMLLPIEHGDFLSNVIIILRGEGGRTSFCCSCSKLSLCHYIQSLTFAEGKSLHKTNILIVPNSALACCFGDLNQGTPCIAIPSLGDPKYPNHQPTPMNRYLRK